LVTFYSEVLRSVGVRDNNFKPLASNDPSSSTTSWSAPLTTDGDIATITSAGPSGVGVAKTVPGALSTNTYPYVVVRGKQGTGGGWSFYVLYTDTTSDFSGIFHNTSFQTKSLKLTSGKTISSIQLNEEISAGTAMFDYVYVCGKPPLQLSQTDLVNGTVYRTGLGSDHAELKLNNWQGKYNTGVNTIGFGDHLHIYLGQGAIPFHVYGGYMELQEPTMPSDEIVINSRGFGLGLLRSKALQIYNNQGPQAIFNDVLNNWVNAANKNGIGASNYQLTASYVQNLGSAFPLYVTNLNHAYNVFREIGDQTVAQNNSAVFFVDPAENVHFVPLGAQGSANWTTDPFPATYATKVSVGTNLVTSRLTYDSKSLANRIHYYSIAQIPGQVDGLTEYATDGALTGVWNIGGFGGGATNANPPAQSTDALHTVTSPVAIGGHANQLTMQNNGSGGFVDATGNMNTSFASPLDLTLLGSQWSPPLIEAYFRIHVTGQSVGNPTATGYYSLIFFKDRSNYFEYNLTSQLANSPFYNAILNIGGNATQDFWYHFLVPIGPNAGNMFLSAPAPNIIPQPVSGNPPWQTTTIGAPNWNLINGIAFFGTFSGTLNNSHIDMYLDGLRILGGRYRLAYDNRTVANGRYPDMSEMFFYDPISKDETTIKNFAQAELERLRRPIVRGTVVTPLLADIIPEQQIQCNIPSANLSNVYLRCTSVTHRFSQNGFLTELGLSNDFRNSQPLDQYKLANVLLQMGENAIFSRELFDLKTAILDPTFMPILDPIS